MTPDEEIAALEARLGPEVVAEVKAGAAQEVSPVEAEIAALEQTLGPDAVNDIRISIPTDEAGNSSAEPGLLSDVKHGVFNVANASVRDTADFAMSLFDLPVWVGLKAGELLTNTPQEDIDKLDRNIDFTDRMDEIMSFVGVTEQQPARSDLEQGALNVVPPLAASVGTLGAVRPAIKAVSDDFMRFLRPDARGVLAGGGVESGLQAFGGERESKEAELAGAVTALVVGGFSEVAETARDLVTSGRAHGNILAQDFNARQRDIAGNAIQTQLGDSKATDIEKVAERSADEVFNRLTAGQLTENRELQRLEREIIMKNPAARADFEASQLSLQDYLKTKLKSPELIGGNQGGEEFIAQYLAGAERAIERLEKAKQQAISEWEQVLRESPKIDDDFGTPLKQIFLTNQASRRKMEKEFWEAAQLDDVPVNSPAMDSLFKEVRDTMSEAGEADVAKGLQRFPDERLIDLIGSWKSRASPGARNPLGFSKGAPKTRPENAVVSADALINTRTNFMDDAAEAMAVGNKALARRNYAIADALLRTITSADPQSPNAYDIARKFSKDFNDDFNRSVIGPLLSRSPHRDARVPANEVMEKFIAPGDRGQTNIMAMRAASGGEIPEVAKQGILADMMKSAEVDFMQGPQLENVAAMEGWASAHAKMIIEAGMTEDVKRFIKFARQQKLKIDSAAEAATSIGKSAAASKLKQYGGTPEKLGAYVKSLFTADAKNPGDGLKELFFTFDLMAPQDLAPEKIAIARQGLRTIVADGVLRALFQASTDASKVNPRIETGKLGQRIIAALESTGQWSTGDIERTKEAMEVLRLQHAGNPLRVKDAAGGSRLPEEISGALETSVLGKIGKLAVLRYIAPRFTSGTGGAKLALAGEAGKGGKALGEKTAEFFGPRLDANGAGDLLAMGMFDNDLWLAMAKREVDLTPADIGLLRSVINKIAKISGKVVTGAVRRPGVGSRVLETVDSEPQQEQ